jgi:hypothetical protein
MLGSGIVVGLVGLDSRVMAFSLFYPAPLHRATAAQRAIWRASM